LKGTLENDVDMPPLCFIHLHTDFTEIYKRLVFLSSPFFTQPHLCAPITHQCATRSKLMRSKIHHNSLRHPNSSVDASIVHAQNHGLPRKMPTFNYRRSCFGSAKAISRGCVDIMPLIVDVAMATFTDHDGVVA
jgi:hypothetical protein